MFASDDAVIHTDFAAVAFPEVFIISGILFVLNTASFLIVFAKYGTPLWKAFIPVWRNATYLHIGEVSRWFSVFAWTPLFPIYFFAFIFATHRISKDFKYDGILTYIGVLCFPLYAVILLFTDKPLPAIDFRAKPVSEPYYGLYDEPEVLPLQAGSLTTAYVSNSSQKVNPITGDKLSPSEEPEPLKLNEEKVQKWRTVPKPVDLNQEEALPSVPEWETYENEGKLFP